jgi:polysaccharide biosynthesis/export protein
MNSNRKFFVYLLLLTLLSSCVNTRTATYFNDLRDSEMPFLPENLEPQIQKNDLLNISVSSLNAEATQIFNLHNTSNQSTVVSGSISHSNGYLVDQDGYIQFPILGNIKAVGLTKKELKNFIINGILKRNLLIDPIVNIRYLNYKITVLGEVANPSVINVPNEKVTLLDAIGLAGDLTLYARRDNVLIIREEEGKRISKHINLNDVELFSSPYYYLKSNDVVYVSPNKSRVASTSRLNQWLPLVLSGLTLAIIAVDRFGR